MTWAIDRWQFTLLVCAAALRLLLFVLFPGLPELLGERVEIATPVIGFKRLQEGVFLYKEGLSPFDGGVYHQSPLLLPVFSLLPDYRLFSLPTNLIWIFVDMIGALALMRIADSKESVSTRLFQSPRRDVTWTTLSIGASFLFNPFTIATCLGRPTSVFTNCSILLAIASAITGNTAATVCTLAFAAHLSLYPLLLAPPIALLTYDCSIKRFGHRNGWTFTASFTAAFMAATAACLFVSFYISGFSWQYLRSTYGVQLLLTDLTPNVGLWWYFFTEMFDSFRNFFLAVFWLHMTSYVGGMTIRLRLQPLFAIVSLLGIIAVFKPYPSISDATLYISLLPLYRHIFSLLRYGFIAAAAIFYASFLGPAFYHLWVYAGSGNANFFYAITLVWSLGLTVLIHDSLFAVLRDEVESERPELKGKDLRQI